MKSEKTSKGEEEMEEEELEESGECGERENWIPRPRGQLGMGERGE